MSEEHRPPEADAAGDELRTDEPDELLALHGGWLLLVFGVSLIILSIVYRSATDIATPFSVLGVSCVVLAAFYSRLEGAVEMGPGGVKMGFIRAFRKRARKDKALTPKQRDEVLNLAVQHIDELPPVVSSAEAKALATRVYSTARGELVTFEERVRTWLTKEGWTVKRLGQGETDFLATRDGDMMYVEAKVSVQPLSRGTLLSWLPQLLHVGTTHPDTRVALFASVPTVTEKGREAALGTMVEIYVAQGEAFERINE